MLDFNGARPQDEPPRRKSGRARSGFRVSVADIKERLHEDVRGFVQWLYSGRAFIHRHEARIGNIYGKVGSSLVIELDGPKVGQWYDHATDQGGDIISLYRGFMGYQGVIDFDRSVKEIAADYFHDIELDKPVWTAVPRVTPSEKIATNKAKWGDKPKDEAEILGPPIAKYNYYDVKGDIIAAVTRYEPKTFRPWCFREIDGAKKWMIGSPQPRPIYHLPEVAKSDVVVLVEGEGKADMLATFGVVTTSLMGGANAVEKANLLPLAKKKVCIWPDNDAAGQKFCQDVTAKLVSIGCDVWIVQIPAGKPPKWDCADCIRDGEDPIALLDAAVEISGNTPPLIKAKPFVLRDPKTIPKRQLLYGNHLIRQFASATFAPSASGKTSLFIVEALALATGRALLGVQPPQRARVWLWNGEDPYDELERRVGAACLHYGIVSEEIDGWLFINSGRDDDSRLVIATQGRDGVAIAVPVVEALIQTIRDDNIDVVVIDPFVSSHKVSENDNSAVDAVAKTWSMIADVTNTAIDLGHHTRKTGGNEATVEDGRGAVALLNAVRPARVLNTMTEDEANKAGISDGRRRYFKVADGKNNLALPVDKEDWFRSASVNLGNGDPSDLLDRGDNMGVVTAWKWPDPLDGMTGADFEKVAAAIRRGQWRESPQAKAWVGYAVAEALGLDATKNGPDRPRVIGMLKVWIRVGSLIVVERPDEHRMMKKFVEVKEEDE